MTSEARAEQRRADDLLMAIDKLLGADALEGALIPMTDLILTALRAERAEGAKTLRETVDRAIGRLESVRGCDGRPPCTVCDGQLFAVIRDLRATTLEGQETPRETTKANHE